jgi:hypothetical protein
MSEIAFKYKSGDQLSASSIKVWRIVQMAVWLVGAAILFCLLFVPSVGVLLFWNILIPVAPALFVVETGLWRNVCPLATTILLPRHWGLSKKKRLTVRQLGMLNLAGVLALYAIVPLRHAIFNTNGPATAFLIIGMALVGTVTGFFFEWKSAWCSGLCPIHPVEKLYGQNTAMALPNAHCEKCMNCVVPCPDSTPNLQPISFAKTIYHELSGLLIVGGLPGFIWGWFHVPDDAQQLSFDNILGIYMLPLIGFTITLVAYGLLTQSVKQKYERYLVGFFAAMGVSCYYWYRIPALFGFGRYAGDGLLVNLSNALPEWSMTVITSATTLFFFYWLVYRKPSKQSWIVRPEFGVK